MAQVTDAWRASDSPQAFVQAVASHGYILATGKRPYVLVDVYGHMNALPKLIVDKSVRLKDVRAFLEKDYPPESLPTVEEARTLAAEHRKTIDAHRDHEEKAEAVARLREAQTRRRREVEAQQRALRQRQHKERQILARRHHAARNAQRVTYLARVKAIKSERRAHKPQGLAAFLGRVSGVALIRRKLHQYQDRHRYRIYLEERGKLRDQQVQRLWELQRRHEMQELDMRRKIRALDQIDRREVHSLEDSLRAAQRIQDRGGRDRMPEIRIDLQYRNRLAPHEERDRHNQWLTDAYEQALTRQIELVDLEKAFTRAAEGEQGSGGAGGSSDGPHPRLESRPEHRKAGPHENWGERRGDQDKDRER